MFFVNSNHLFALYDMHFKFYIAVIFLELKRVLKGLTNFQSLNDAFNE